jgi:hypothetical protein
MKEALSSSETSVLIRATRCNIPEDATLHSHLCENLKSYISGTVHKEFFLACQTVHSTYYCDISQRPHKNIRRLHPEPLRQKNWQLQYDSVLFCASFVSREFFNQHYCHPPSSLLT